MKKRILIVDDEPDIVSYLELVLQDQGYETESAGDGNEALESVKRSPRDLVPLDIPMPKASGTPFYKEMRTDPELSKIPVVIVTAVTGLGGDKYAYEQFISNRRLVPAPEAFFPKPIDREEFVETINGLLED